MLPYKVSMQAFLPLMVFQFKRVDAPAIPFMEPKEAAGSLGVGPSKGDISWWSSSADDVTTRACLFDDEYVFNADGSYKNIMGSQTWPSS